MGVFLTTQELRHVYDLYMNDQELVGYKSMFEDIRKDINDKRR